MTTATNGERFIIAPRWRAVSFMTGPQRTWLVGARRLTNRKTGRCAPFGCLSVTRVSFDRSFVPDPPPRTAEEHGVRSVVSRETQLFQRAHGPGVRLEVAVDLADRVVQRTLERLYPRLDATLYALVTYPAVRAGEEAGRRGHRLVRQQLDRLEEHYGRCLERLEPLLALDGEESPVHRETQRYRLTARSPQAARLLELYVRADRVACGITHLWLRGRWCDAERARALYVLVKRPLYTSAAHLMCARTRLLPTASSAGHGGASPSLRSPNEGGLA
jgi:hypothetical protein